MYLYTIPVITIWLIMIFSIGGTTAEQTSPRDRTSFSLSFNEYQGYHGLDKFRDSSHAQLDLSGSQVRPSWTLQARPTTVYRPRSQEALQRARFGSLHHSRSEKVQWDTVETLGPDVEDRHTLAQLARMTANAYALPGQKNWYDIDPNWNNVGTMLAPCELFGDLILF